MKNNETRQQLSVSTGTGTISSSSKYQICDNQNILHYYPGRTAAAAAAVIFNLSPD